MVVREKASLGTWNVYEGLVIWDAGRALWQFIERQIKGAKEDAKSGTSYLSEGRPS